MGRAVASDVTAYSYIRASDIIYVMHAQTVDTRLSFPTRPALEPRDEAGIEHALCSHMHKNNSLCTHISGRLETMCSYYLGDILTLKGIIMYYY